MPFSDMLGSYESAGYFWENVLLLASIQPTVDKSLVEGLLFTVVLSVNLNKMK